MNASLAVDITCEITSNDIIAGNGRLWFNSLTTLSVIMAIFLKVLLIQKFSYYYGILRHSLATLEGEHEFAVL